MYMMASSANLVRACARANPGLLAGLAPTRRGALLPVTVPRAAPAHVPRFNSRRQLKASAYMDTRGEKQQKQPGVQKEMKQQPISTENTHRGSGKLEGKVRCSLRAAGSRLMRKQVAAPSCGSTRRGSRLWDADSFLFLPCCSSFLCRLPSSPAGTVALVALLPLPSRARRVLHAATFVFPELSAENNTTNL